MVKKKVSLGSSPDLDEAAGGTESVLPAQRAAAVSVLELFFNTGIILHDVAMPRGLPDTVSSFILMKPGAAGAPAPGAPGATVSVRRANAGEEPDVEISATDHLSELANRWLPV